MSSKEYHVVVVNHKMQFNCCIHNVKWQIKFAYLVNIATLNPFLFFILFHIINLAANLWDHVQTIDKIKPLSIAYISFTKCNCTLVALNYKIQLFILIHIEQNKKIGTFFSFFFLNHIQCKEIVFNFFLVQWMTDLIFFGGKWQFYQYN